MAATDQGATLTRQHRRQQQTLRTAQTVESLRLWGILDLDDIDSAREAWLEASLLSVRDRHRRSRAMAAVYYRTFRQAETGLFEDVTPVRPELAMDRLRANLEITGPARFKRLVSRGYPQARAGQVAAVATAGAAARFTMEGGRQELQGQVKRDRRAQGWQRVATARPCAFCLMLTSRGPVYKSQAGADFPAHDHCGCTVEPVLSDQAAWTDQALDARALWQRAQREAAEAGELYRGTSNNALNAFRRTLEATRAAA